MKTQTMSSGPFWTLKSRGDDGRHCWSDRIGNIGRKKMSKIKLLRGERAMRNTPPVGFRAEN